MNSEKIPIQYQDLVDVRFADLDFYGHVNSKHYIDFVATARLNFMQRDLKTSIEEIAKKNIGFFLIRSIINFKRPIVGLQRVLVTSHVQTVRDNSVLEIPFEIKSTDGVRLFSDGVLEFALIDMKTMRKTTAPDWLYPLFFETRHE